MKKFKIISEFDREVTESEFVELLVNDEYTKWNEKEAITVFMNEMDLAQEWEEDIDFDPESYRLNYSIDEDDLIYRPVY